jgi:hypothetical protein
MCRRLASRYSALFSPGLLVSKMSHADADGADPNVLGARHAAASKSQAKAVRSDRAVHVGTPPANQSPEFAGRGD